MANRTVVNEEHVSKICDDIGTCWHDLGIKLNIPLKYLRNIDTEETRCREKARRMLYEWIKINERRSKTLQHLIDALEGIGERKIAEDLLMQLVDQQIPLAIEESDCRQSSGSGTNEEHSIPDNGGNYGSSYFGLEEKMATVSKSKMTSEAANTPLDEQSRKILNSVKVELVKDMDAKEVLLHMSPAHVFNDREEEAIKAKATRSERCELLLSTLPRKGAKAYRSFVQALQEVQPHLAILINKAAESQSCSRCRELMDKLDALEKEMDATKQKNNQLEEEVERYKKEIVGLRKVVTPKKKTEEVPKKGKKRDPKR